MSDDLEFRIAKLTLEPGDILVAKADQILSRDQAQYIHDMLTNSGVKNKILVLGKGTNLEILTRAEIENIIGKFTTETREPL